MSLPPLTKRQHETAKFIYEYTRKHRIAPSLEEIGSHSGTCKTSVFERVRYLIEKGYLVKVPRISRGLRFTPAGEAHFSAVKVDGRLMAIYLWLREEELTDPDHWDVRITASDVLDRIKPLLNLAEKGTDND